MGKGRIPMIYEGGYSRETGSNRKAIGLVTNIDIIKKRFLELFMVTGNVSKTADLLGIAVRNVYMWRSKDEQFATDWQAAKEVALGNLEDEAHRRAYYGVDKPVYQGGKLAGTVKEYSDTLMIVLLKAMAPEKYRERWSGELAGANGQPLNPPVVNHVHSNVPMAENEADIDYNKSMLKPTLFEEAEVVSDQSTPAQQFQDRVDEAADKYREDLDILGNDYDDLL